MCKQVTSVLYNSRVHLRRLFAIMDKDKSGTISVDEFKDAIHQVNNRLSNPLSDLQITNLHRAIDQDGDGEIKYDEFFDALKVVDLEEHKDNKHKKRKRDN